MTQRASTDGYAGWRFSLLTQHIGRAQGPGQHLYDRVSTRQALDELAARAGFPEHGLVVCGSPTTDARAERWECVADDHHEIREVDATLLADPYRCNECNP